MNPYVDVRRRAQLVGQPTDRVVIELEEAGGRGVEPVGVVVFGEDPPPPAGHSIPAKLGDQARRHISDIAAVLGVAGWRLVVKAKSTERRGRLHDDRDVFGHDVRGEAGGYNGPERPDEPGYVDPGA